MSNCKMDSEYFNYFIKLIFITAINEMRKLKKKKRKRIKKNILQKYGKKLLSKYQR